MVDWTRGDLAHSLRVLMVDPFDLSTVRGELSGVTGGKLELHYYSDTRAGATITTIGDHGFDGSSWLRIVHTVSDYTGVLLVEPLFTGFVGEASWSGEGDSLNVDWTLQSSLSALDSAVPTYGYSVAYGAKALDVYDQICSTLRRPHRVDNANDYVFGANTVYEPGDSYLSILNGVCDSSSNRLGVDADGTISISRYTAPSSRGVDFSCDERDKRGMVIGDVSGDYEEYELPSRVIVRSEDGDNSVTGAVDVPQGSFSSFDRRGFRNDRFEKVTGLWPFSNDAARDKARQLLDESLNQSDSISHGLMYRPLNVGMIERLTTKDGITKRWMVSDASLDLMAWTWELDLKGGYSD